MLISLVSVSCSYLVRLFYMKFSVHTSSFHFTYSSGVHGTSLLFFLHQVVTCVLIVGHLWTNTG